MTNKKEIIKTALLYIIYQIVLWAGHMIITLFNDYYTERIVSLVFSVALFIALVCITKPKALSAVCMVLTQIILYLIVICHPNFDGWLCGYYIEYGAHGFGNGNLSWNLNIYDDALLIAISKVIYESVILALCAIIVGIIKLLCKFKKDKEEGQKDLKNKFVSAVKFSLIIIAAQIVMYFLNYLQILCPISYVCNSLISITIVVALAATAVILCNVKLRYFLLVPFVWAAIFYILPVSGIYLMFYVDTSFIYEHFGWTVTREIIAITLLQFLTASITVGVRKLVLYLRNKPTEQIEEKQE